MQELDRHLHRLERLRASLEPHQVVVMCQPSDIAYFTGLQVITQNEREAFLVVSHTASHLFVAAFTPLPSFLEKNTPDLTGLTVVHGLQIYGIITAVQASFAATGLTVPTVLFDEQHMFIAEANQIKKSLSTATTAPIEYSAFDRNLIWKLRQQKDAAEVTLMKKTGQVISQALAETLASLQLGETEQEVAYRLDTLMHQIGSAKPAFPTIVAFGEHAALPHHQPGDTALTVETCVLIDCGAAVSGYNSDITRTVWFGEHPSDEFQKIEKIVKAAYEVGKKYLLERTAEPELFTASQLDKNVRKYIEEAGYGKSFIHTTGHGIGLEVHEPPSLYLTNETPLQDNIVITIEPGIYLPGQLGYRFENTLLITSQGAEELTQ